MTPWQAQHALWVFWGKIVLMFWGVRKTNQILFWTCSSSYFTSVLWHLNSHEVLFPYSPESIKFLSSSHKQVRDMRPCESPLPGFSEVKSHFSCFGQCQKKNIFETNYFISIVWRLNSREFCPPSPELEFVSSSHKQVHDMRVRESPLPSTNTSFNLGWLGAETGRIFFLKWTQALLMVA